MKTRRTTRRSFLETVALGASAVSLGTTAGSRSARAAVGVTADGMPRRFLGFYSPNGINETTGWDACWASKGATPQTFTLRLMNVPLEPYRQHLVLFDGLDMYDPFMGDTHGAGLPLAITGGRVPFVGNTYPPSSPSIDQYLGAQIGKQVTPKNPAVHLISHPLRYPTDSTSWAADGTNVSGIQDVYKAYARFFADLPGTSPTKPTVDPAVMARLKLRQSVLDSVDGDLGEFRARLGAADRMRADAQLDAIRTLEQRLSVNATKPPSGVTCAPGNPAKPALNLRDSRTWPDQLQMHMDLIFSLFACDVTRFINFAVDIGQQDNDFGVNFAPVNMTTTDVHSLSHDYRDKFVDAKTVFHAKLASLVDRLAKTPEGNGVMLDNTLIYVYSDIARGHTHRRMPLMTIGGKNLGVNVGQYLTVANGTYHSRLLTSILRAMGLAVNQYGNPDVDSSPLPGYLATT